jgi:hypothetical protein
MMRSIAASYVSFAPVRVSRRLRFLVTVLGILSLPGLALVHGAEAGVLTGSVSNTATGNLLEGARIELPQLGLSALTDNTGRYVLSGVPAGTHDVVASYIGLDASRVQVTVTAGQRAVRDFDLSSGIYLLDAFKVTGEREGSAAAITAHERGRGGDPAAGRGGKSQRRESRRRLHDPGHRAGAEHNHAGRGAAHESGRAEPRDEHQ